MGKISEAVSDYFSSVFNDAVLQNLEDAAALRKAMQSERLAISETRRAAKSTLLCQEIADLLTLSVEADWSTYQRMLGFYPLLKKGEADLRPLYQAWLKARKELYLPVTSRDELFFYKITELDEERTLAAGNFGVFEPVDRSVLYKELYPGFDRETVAVVPGLAFDFAGNRIGYGKGYYDRFLAKHPDIYKIGVCFSEQYLEEIPSQKWDVRMDAVCAV